MRAGAVVVLAILVAGCGGQPAATPTVAHETGPPGWTTYRDNAAGFTVEYPSDWFRARENLTPALDDPREILSLATYPLRPGSEACAAHLPVNALRALGPADAFLTIQERRDPSTEQSGPRPESFSLAADTRGDADVCIGSREPITMWVPFRDRGRAFYALYVVGPDASAETRRDLLRILDGLRFDARP